MTYRALHATNVSHYQHVMTALSRLYQEVGLLGHFEVPEPILKSLEHLPGSAPLVGLLARRRSSHNPGARRHWIGPAEFVHPVASRIGMDLNRTAYRRVNSWFAERTAHVSRNYDVLHFIEGIGFRALEKNTFAKSICERRNMHHAVFEEYVSPIGGFPSTVRTDPVGDILDFEYAASDLIITYSTAAKKSFTSRGIAEEKVKVVPIGFGPQMPRITRARDPYDLVYVGRADVYKGFDLAVAVVELLGPPYRLKFAGQVNPDVSQWLRKHPAVDHLGFLNRLELRNLYSTSSAMILPSVESYGLAAAEAVYHGLPLICGPETGIAEYLPSERVRIVPGRDPASWARAVSESVGDFAGQRRFPQVPDYGPIDRAFEQLTLEAAADRLARAYSG